MLALLTDPEIEMPSDPRECLQKPVGVMTPGFGFVGAARERRNTPCISRSRDAVTEPKNKSAARMDLKTLPSTKVCS
jgi:hypothetical protein